jgi:hypothetical protein
VDPPMGVDKERRPLTVVTEANIANFDRPGFAVARKVTAAQSQGFAGRPRSSGPTISPRADRRYELRMRGEFPS